MKHGRLADWLPSSLIVEVRRLEELDLEDRFWMHVLELRWLVDFSPNSVDFISDCQASLVEVLYFIVKVSDNDEDRLHLVWLEQSQVHLHYYLDDAVLWLVAEVLQILMKEGSCKSGGGGRDWILTIELQLMMRIWEKASAKRAVERS